MKEINLVSFTSQFHSCDFVPAHEIYSIRYRLVRSMAQWLPLLCLQKD